MFLKASLAGSFSFSYVWSITVHTLNVIDWTFHFPLLHVVLGNGPNCVGWLDHGRYVVGLEHSPQLFRDPLDIGQYYCVHFSLFVSGGASGAMVVTGTLSSSFYSFSSSFPFTSKFCSSSSHKSQNSQSGYPLNYNALLMCSLFILKSVSPLSTISALFISVLTNPLWFRQVPLPSMFPRMPTCSPRMPTCSQSWLIHPSPLPHLSLCHYPPPVIQLMLSMEFLSVNSCECTFIRIVLVLPTYHLHHWGRCDAVAEPSVWMTLFTYI